MQKSTHAAAWPTVSCRRCFRRGTPKALARSWLRRAQWPLSFLKELRLTAPVRLAWSHKRVGWMCCELGLSTPRRTKRRIPHRESLAIQAALLLPAANEPSTKAWI